MRRVLSALSPLMLRAALGAALVGSAVVGAVHGPALADVHRVPGAIVAPPAHATVAVTPTCGDGSSVTVGVRGTGFTGGHRAYVRFNGRYVAVRVPIAADGSWQTAATLPAQSSGTHDVFTEFTDRSGTIARRGPSTTYQVPCAVLSVEPARAAARRGPAELTLVGTGYVGGMDVGFTLGGAALAETARPDRGGSFRRVVRLPTWPPCGTHEVVGTERPWPGDEFPPPPRRATTQLTITCPTLTVAPATVEQPSLPRPLTWTLTGYDPDSLVDLRIAGRPQRVVRTDRAGAVEVDVTTDRLPCDVLPATATQVGEGDMPAATASVTVTCPPTRVVTAEPTPEPVPAITPTPLPTTTTSFPTPSPSVTAAPTIPVPAATLVVNPGVARTGTAVFASGSGFTPGASVRLRWVLPGGTQSALTQVLADAAGAFSVQSLVLARERLGPRTLVAVEAAPVEEQARAATAPLLVVPGSLQPGRHGLVVRR